MKKNVSPRSSGERVTVPLETRLPALIGGPESAVALLSTWKVGVIGCGSVGRSAALDLARMYPAGMVLADPKHLKPASLITHPCMPGDVSEPKASNLGRYVKELSPNTRVFVHDGPVQTMDLTEFANCDVIIMATDNLKAEVEVSQRCLWLGIPLAHASIYGPALVAQVRFFGNRDAQGPCPVCGFSKAEWDALNRETLFSCEGAQPETGKAQTLDQPTMSLSCLCAMAAELTIMQLLKHRLGLGKDPADTLVEYCGFTHKTVVSPLSRNPDCPCEHIRYHSVPNPSPIRDSTLRQLAQTADMQRGKDLKGVSFRVDELIFRELAACRCNQCRLLMRFSRTGEDMGNCNQCGSHIRPQPFYSYDPVPAEVVQEELDRPLRDLGAASAQWAFVRRGPRGAFLFHSTQRP